MRYREDPCDLEQVNSLVDLQLEGGGPCLYCATAPSVEVPQLILLPAAGAVVRGVIFIIFLWLGFTFGAESCSQS